MTSLDVRLPPSRQRVLEALANGQASVRELAQALDVSPMTIRHHLLRLQADGLVEFNGQNRHGSPGRPALLYQLARHGTREGARSLAGSVDDEDPQLLVGLPAEIGRSRRSPGGVRLTSRVKKEMVEFGLSLDRLESIASFPDEYFPLRDKPPLCVATGDGFDIVVNPDGPRPKLIMLRPTDSNGMSAREDEDGDE